MVLTRYQGDTPSARILTDRRDYRPYRDSAGRKETVRVMDGQ